MGVQEWTIVIGVVVVVALLFWAAAAWRRRRYDDIFGGAPGRNEDEEELYSSELPSGGARTVGYRDVEELERTNAVIRDRAEANKPKLTTQPRSSSIPRVQTSLFGDEQTIPDANTERTPRTDLSDVPLLLDPSDEHSTELPSPKKEETAIRAVDKDDSPSSEVQGSLIAEIERESDLESIETYLEGSPSTEAQTEADAEPEEATTKDKRQERRKKRKSRKSKTNKKNTSDTPEEVSEAKEPPEALIVNLMTNAEVPYNGETLLQVLTDLGMRFGDMQIFHYRGERGTAEPKFSMANLLAPGIFDIDDTSTLDTHALCFFFELEAGKDNLAIYESMIDVITTLQEHVGGEMRDDGRSVFTMQTSEHYRNRIRDFQRRRLLKKA